MLSLWGKELKMLLVTGSLTPVAVIATVATQPTATKVFRLLI